MLKDVEMAWRSAKNHRVGMAVYMQDRSTQCKAEGKAFHNAITCSKNEMCMRWIYNMAGKEVVGRSF